MERSFERYVPFGDRREVILRRGRELGASYGFEIGRRTVTVGGRELELVRYRELLSPPPLQPGQPLMTPAQAAHYTPESEVYRAPGLEVLLRRTPDGFTDEEVVEILARLGC